MIALPAKARFNDADLFPTALGHQGVEHDLPTVKEVDAVAHLAEVVNSLRTIIMIETLRWRRRLAWKLPAGH